MDEHSCIIQISRDLINFQLQELESLTENLSILEFLLPVTELDLKEKEVRMLDIVFEHYTHRLGAVTKQFSNLNNSYTNLRRDDA